jgi:hypothetical protein
MKIQVGCPRCQRKYSLKSSLKGKKLKCKCGEVFLLGSTGALKDAVEPQIQAPAGFWDQRFDEIRDDLPKEKPVVAPLVKPPREQASFEAILPMDPHTGKHIYGFICFAIFLLLVTLPFLFARAINPFSIAIPLFCIAVPIFGLFMAVYWIVAHYNNHMTISIRKEGVSISYQKRLPWPCWDIHIPIESIEEIYIECNTVKASWFLRRAEYSHTSYSFRNSYHYVFVYDLYCSLKDKRWTKRLATMEDRDVAKTMRLHLKRMFPET